MIKLAVLAATKKKKLKDITVKKKSLEFEELADIVNIHQFTQRSFEYEASRKIKKRAFSH